ncbi:DNA-directed RNA polymerase, partial [Stenotrophomonas sp. MA5]|uniref:DNA-directed RNA polymerase n=1 Tax=Stenotrophomonas sp. MA5 TaxID=2508572 RepID=UPI001F50C015
MSVVLRDAFVAMHSEDIIGRLHEEFITRYKDHMYLASVVAHSPIGQEITALRKQIKSRSGNSSELALER